MRYRLRMNRETVTPPPRILDRARALLERSAPDLSPEAREELVSRVAELIASEVDRERRRAERLCRERSRRWETTTSAAESAPGPAREEARARRNEAEYLADLIASELDLPGPGTLD